MRVARWLVGLLLVAGGSLLAAPIAAAAAAPAAPTGLHLTAGATSIAVRWNLPTGGSAPSAVIVTRSGPSADGATPATQTLAPTSAVTLDGLVPGGRYAIGVAFVDGSGTGPTAVRRMTLSSAGLPTLVDQTPDVTTADPASGRGWSDFPCALYHYNPAVCGHAGTTFRTTGYTPATSDAWWSLSVATRREFGCLRTGTTEYRPRVTLSARVQVDQYGFWEYEPVSVGADGTSRNGDVHRFTNPGSWSGADEMPHYTCPPAGTSPRRQRRSRRAWRCCTRVVSTTADR